MKNQLLLVNKEGKVENRLYSVLPKEEIFDESWLQKLLISSPELLPVHEIDPAYSRLIPLGGEIRIKSGIIDGLYITLEGLVCLVETKLWRNPESYRAAALQLIDYAKDLLQMSLDEFKQAVEFSQINGERPNFQTRILHQLKDADLPELEKKIQESLNGGKFLLLMVTDRITPKMTEILEDMRSASDQRFGIRAIEFQVFKKSKETTWPLYMMPRIAGR